MKQLESAVLLNMVPEIGPVRFQRLRDRFGELPRVFTASEQELASVEGISSSLAQAILYGGRQTQLLQRELELARAQGAEILTLEDERYPSFLKTIIDPPPVLYAKGDLRLLEEPGIAVVGSRRPTPYGEKAAQTLARELAEAGVLVVSGMARGIDTIAHRAVLEARGKTIAVLGSGFLKIYPPENRKLFEQIAKDGLLLSEFPLSASPEAHHFLRRNRIISGLSLGTLVVEAGEKSGALVTAKYAAEQGRDIFAVPGPISSKMSAGPHRLLRDGARLVETAADILEEIGPAWAGYGKRASVIRADADGAPLAPVEEGLFNLISFEPVHIDFLSDRCALSAGEFAQVLLALEMKGVVKSLPGKMYARN